ncbi:hypothetical protein VNO80_22635 [Phaseolus coccineus]|uniref:Uncharacterized protein n=1 Tax=Phaseolus coccineus TaxID=3886 RepID=A0AAN9M635_PHACN
MILKKHSNKSGDVLFHIFSLVSFSCDFIMFDKCENRERGHLNCYVTTTFEAENINKIEKEKKTGSFGVAFSWVFCGFFF